MTKFVLIGCLYREDNLFDVPDGDVLVCTGDFSSRSSGRDRLVQFNQWLGRQPHRHKLVVFGDSDVWCDANEDEARKILSNAKVLVDEMVEIDGFKIYGSPWTPNSMKQWYGTKAHAFNEDDDYIQNRWASIPKGLDLLVTHCPPGHGHLGEAVRRAQPLVHCFSHGEGQSASSKVSPVNVELFTPEGVVIGTAKVVELHEIGVSDLSRPVVPDTAAP
jgi:hypothetical protein